MGRGSFQRQGGKGTRSHGGKVGKGSKGSKSGKGSQGSQGSGSKGHPDGGLSPPAPPPAKEPPVGGKSLLEGGWRMVPVPEDRVLKVLVPLLGNALCCDDENGSC